MRQKTGIRDLVAVEMEDRQHTPITGRVDEFVSVPTRCQRSRLGLAVADDAGDDQIGVVECGSVGMAERVSQFASFVNAAGRFRRHMAGNSAGKAELLEQLLHALGVLADVWINFAVRSFEVGMGHERRSTMAGPDNVDHLEVVALDHSVQVDVEHVQAG